MCLLRPPEVSWGHGGNEAIKMQGTKVVGKQDKGEKKDRGRGSGR